MKKYKYQCDNSECNHQFVDDNPSSCPKCGKDDFTILSQVNSNQKYIMISAAILVAISTLFIFYNISSDDNEDPKKTKELISITPYANYFEIEDYEDFDDINLDAVDVINYSQEKSKIFPCKSGEFKISATKGDVSEEKFIDFKLDGKPDKSACKTKLQVKTIYADMSDCKYKIQTNDDANALVSLNENSGFKSNLAWSFDECRNSDNFYIKHKDSRDIITYPIEKASCNKPLEFNEDVFVNSFNLYIKDIRTNRSQFISSYDTYTPKFILLNEEFGLIDFITKIRTMDRVDQSSVESLKLSKSDIRYNKNTREITLKISR